MRKSLCLLILAALPSFGAIAFVQSAKGVTGNGASSVSATFSSTPTIGNLVVAGCGENNVTTQDLSDNQASGGNTYSTATSVNAGSKPSFTLSYSLITKASGTFTVTCTPVVTGYLIIFIAEYSGIQSSSPLDQTATGFSGTTSVTSGSFSTVFANELIVAVGVNQGGGVTIITPSSGFTIRESSLDGNVNELGELQDNSVTSTGTYSVSVSYSNPADMRIGVASFIGTSQPAATPIRHRATMQ